MTDVVRLCPARKSARKMLKQLGRLIHKCKPTCYGKVLRVENIHSGEQLTIIVTDVLALGSCGHDVCALRDKAPEGFFGGLGYFCYICGMLVRSSDEMGAFWDQVTREGHAAMVRSVPVVIRHL